MTGWIITKLIEYYLNEKFFLHNKFIRLNVLTNIGRRRELAYDVFRYLSSFSGIN